MTAPRDLKFGFILPQWLRAMGGVTAGYIMKRVDRPLIGSADRVTGHIDRAMRGIESAATVHDLAAVRRA